MFTFFFFWISTIHSPTFFLPLQNLLVKLSFCKKLCTLKKIFYYVKTCKILWEWYHKYHLHQHGTYIKLLLIPLTLLYLLVFWINLFVVKWCIELYHIHEFKIQGWNWFYNLWQLNGKRCKSCFQLTCLASNIKK
jgi:hypothetical protein